MTTQNPRIALISATPAAIPAAEAALRAEFPAADAWNLLDDKLLSDADAQGGLTKPLAERMRRLIGYATYEGADGVLLTCSLYGPVTHSVDVPIPVLAADEAAFDELVAGRHAEILVVASFEVALRESTERLRAWLSDHGSPSRLRGVVAADAFEPAKRGEFDAVGTALLDACRKHADGVDAIFLAQYSLARAGATLSAALGLPVISGPTSSAVRLRGLFPADPT